MKFALKIGILGAALLAGSGCVYEPGYGYVRGDGYNGDAYYGAAYDSGPDYYGYGNGYGPGYYGYGPTLGLGFYSNDYYHRHYRGPSYWGHRGHGDWHGHGGDWHGGHDSRGSRPREGSQGHSRASSPSSPHHRR
jgi:hypothetical protein